MGVLNKINELRNKTIAVLKSTCELAKAYKLPEKEKKLNVFLERLKRGRTIVLVCGEFKRGKSSFINALIEEPNLCPVDIDITTNMATQIQYSEKEYARVYFNKESGKRPVEVKREDIPKYVTEAGNKENNQMVQMVDIGIKKDMLNKGVMVLVDTPGVGSLNVKHSEVTAMYLNYADVILFVSDTNAPLTTAEIDFVKRAAKYCSNIYFILTKIDKVRDYKIIEESNREKLSEALGKSPESIRIFPVSSLNKLDYLKTGDEESLEDSQYKAMEESLIKELSSSVAKNILLTPLQAAKADGEAVLKSLSLQLQTIQQENLEKRKEIEEKLSEINEKYKLVQKSNSRWQMLLNDDTVSIKMKMRKTLNTGFSNLEDDIKVKVLDKKFRESPDTINSFIKNYIIDTMKDVDSVVNSEISELQSKIYELIGEDVEIEIGEFSSGFEEIQSDKILDGRSKFEKFRDWGRNVSINTGAFAAGGAAVGGLLGGVIGFFGLGGIGAVVAAQAGAGYGGMLGAALGSMFGATTHKKEIAKRMQMDVVRACMEIIRENKANCIETMDVQFTKMVSDVRNSIVFSIQENMETIEKTRNEINKNLNLNAQEVAQRTQKLQEYIKQVNALLNGINSIASEVQAL